MSGFVPDDTCRQNHGEDGDPTLTKTKVAFWGGSEPNLQNAHLGNEWKRWFFFFEFGIEDKGLF